ncbi:MAG: alpha/beta hydrolase [Candidatus Saccharibacteria bacterium]
MIAGLVVALAIVASIYVSLAYGPVAIRQVPGIDKRQSPQALIFTPVSAAAPASAIIIFPANLVAPSEYGQLAQTLAQRTGQPVVVAAPKFRLEAFAPDIAALERYYPKVTRWTFIGHSAGAAAACKSSSDPGVRAPVRIILLAGYCRRSTEQPSLAILAIGDPFIPFGRHRQAGATTMGLQTSDHFFPVSKHSHAAAYDRTVDLLTAWISRS